MWQVIAKVLSAAEFVLTTAAPALQARRECIEGVVLDGVGGASGEARLVLAATTAETLGLHQQLRRSWSPTE